MGGRLVLMALLGASAIACSRSDGSEAGAGSAASAGSDDQRVPTALEGSYDLPRAEKAQDIRGRRYLVAGPGSLSAGVLAAGGDPGIGPFPGQAVELEQVGARMAELGEQLRLAEERGIPAAEVDMAALRAEKEAEERAADEARKRAEAERARAAEEERRRAEEARKRAQEELQRLAEELNRQAAAVAAGDEPDLTLDLDDPDAFGGVVGGLGSIYSNDYDDFRRPAEPAAPPAAVLRPQPFGDDRPVLAVDSAMPLGRLEAVLARLCDQGAHLAVQTPAAPHALQHPVALGTLRAGTCSPADDAGSGYWHQEGRRLVLEIAADRVRLLEDEYTVAVRPEVIDDKALPGILQRAGRDSYDYGGPVALWLIAGEGARVADLIAVLDAAARAGVGVTYLADRTAWKEHREAIETGPSGHRGGGYGGYGAYGVGSTGGTALPALSATSRAASGRYRAGGSGSSPASASRR